MCGRYVISPPMMRRIEKALQTSFPEMETNLNVAPTTLVPVILAGEEGGYLLKRMRWGLIPHWSGEPSTPYSTFNARVESAATKPAFRESFARRRCLVPALGFYEWHEEEGKKRAYYFTSRDYLGFAFAGLWDLWKREGEEIYSCTILVGPPNALVAPLHDRMPVILREADYVPWLDTAGGAPMAGELSTPFPAEGMRVGKIGPGQFGKALP